MATNSVSQPIYIPEGHYYTRREVARLMGTQPNTVLYWIRKGWLETIPAPGVGHFISREALARFHPQRWGPRFKDEE